MPKTSKCDSHADCLRKIREGKEIPERAYCYMSRCMQRKTAIRAFNARRRQMYELFDRVISSSRGLRLHGPALKQVLLEKEMEQREIHKQMLTEVKHKALMSQRRSEAKRELKQEIAKRHPVFIMGSGDKTFVFVSQALKRAIDDIVRCYNALDDAFKPNTANSTGVNIADKMILNGYHTLLRWTFLRPQMTGMYSIEAQDVLQYEDDVRLFLLAFLQDFKETSKISTQVLHRDWGSRVQCAAIKPKTERVLSWLNSVAFRLESS